MPTPRPEKTTPRLVDHSRRVARFARRLDAEGWRVKLTAPRAQLFGGGWRGLSNPKVSGK